MQETLKTWKINAYFKQLQNSNPVIKSGHFFVDTLCKESVLVKATRARIDKTFLSSDGYSKLIACPQQTATEHRHQPVLIGP
jgi:hypothetical protein